MKTIKFYTLGCKVNQYDTQSIREQFIPLGFKELASDEKADVYVINTCTVTHKADSESLRLIRKAKRENPYARIIVTGCLAELDTGRIKEEGIVDLSVRNKDKGKIAKLFYSMFEKDKKLEPNSKNLYVGISNFKGHTRAFLKIQDGCNNFCSYCKVPLVRGPSKSKPLDSVIKEAEKLAGAGFKEIVLTGICLGAYGEDLKEKKGILHVIEALENIGGLLRIRLSSIEAGDVTDGLIKKIADSKKLCPHLHIPIQSGDDTILKKMHRNYTGKVYLNLIKKIKNRIPGIAITTDCLVGFPGETDGNFKNTADLIRKIAPLRVHIFPYSKREGTSAANLGSDVPSGTIKERVKRLKEAADKCSSEYRKKFLNKVMGVLIEGESKAAPGFLEGHTDNYIRVILESGLNLKNKLIPVKLKKLEISSFLAQLV
ncbi:MAG: tRNA (N(6)-L-threonylcarbamoyladenosine(37)-C(2))-methylthiotransferase MtaB [Candidatus Omnitrophota bacterium]